MLRALKVLSTTLGLHEGVAHAMVRPMQCVQHDESDDLRPVKVGGPVARLDELFAGVDY